MLIRRILFRLAPLGLVILLAGCAVVLGPGFRLQKEALVARYQPASPGELRVRTDVVMVNNGDQPLPSLQIRVPRLVRRADRVSVEVSGRQVAASPLSGGGGVRLDFPLDPPLAPGKSREFRLEYAIPVKATDSVLEPEDWFATAVTPHRLFASGNPRADTVRVAVQVPAGYRAFTTGVFLGSRRSHGETEYRYEVQPSDFDPFLLIGKYLERKVSIGHRDVEFWTLQPLDAACAQSAAAHLIATSDVYRSVFGSLWTNPPAIPVIQVSPTTLLPIEGQSGRARSVPGGTMINLTPTQICGDPQEFLQLADRALAATWFGWAVRPKPGAQAILGSGARDYATLAAGESREGTGYRTRRVAVWMDEYDRLRKEATPVPPVDVAAGTPLAEQRMAAIQSALCFVALEDQFGAEPIHRALAHLVDSLRGGTAGLDVLRSALEQETGRNLYNLLHQWFRQPGISAAFRERYRATRAEFEFPNHSFMTSRRTK